jgi:hypothetical protein
MKFFKPELYLRYSSPDDAIADCARTEWEQAVCAYHTHLSRFSTKMSDRVRDLAEELCLHDAELLSLQQDVTDPLILPPMQAPVALISVRSIGRITQIFYSTWAKIGLSTAPGEWPPCGLRPHWLCDEIDLEPGPSSIHLYHHRILWSDGRVITIPFFDLVVHSFSEPDPQTAIIAQRRV